MIMDYEGVAIDMSNVKAIRMNGMDLIFEFNTVLQYLENPFSKQVELHPVDNSPLVVSFKISEHMTAAYSYWLENWKETQQQP